MIPEYREKRWHWPRKDGMWISLASIPPLSHRPELHERVRLLRFPVRIKRVKRYLEKNVDRKVKEGVYRIVRNPVVKLAKDAVIQRNFALRVWELCENASYDVVHCHDYHTLGIGVYLKRKKDMSLVYDPHERFSEMNEKNRWERIMDDRRKSWKMEWVDHLITANELLQQEFQSLYPDLSITVIRNIPESLSELPLEKNYFHQTFGLSSNDQVVLYQGGFFPNSGLEELVSSISYLPEHCKLVLLGFGTWENRLKQLVKQKGLDHRVFFHQPLWPRELLRVTAHADLGVVLSSHTDRTSRLTPHKVFEYIQAGIPVVASDQPGKAIVVGTYQTGKLVDSRNVKEVAGAIQEVLADPDPWLIGTHKARKRLCWEKEQERLTRLYQQIDLARSEKKAEKRKQEDVVSIQPHLRQL